MSALVERDELDRVLQSVLEDRASKTANAICETNHHAAIDTVDGHVTGMYVNFQYMTVVSKRVNGEKYGFSFITDRSEYSEGQYRTRLRDNLDLLTKAVDRNI